MTALEDKLAEALRIIASYTGKDEGTQVCISVAKNALRAYDEAKEREQIMARGCKGCAFYYIHGFPRCCRDEPDACHEYDLYVPRTESQEEEK